jgi:hypothetical protein
MGGDEPRLIDGNSFSRKGHAGLKSNMDMVHAYIANALTQRENASVAGRKEQDPVVIHCFSGMSWKYALVAYDAVRDYEGSKMGSKMAKDPTQWDNAREVQFAPPRIRNYSSLALGNELYEIVNMQ